MIRLALRAVVAAAFLCGATGWARAASAPAPNRFGKIERVKIVEAAPIVVPARLDLGGDQTRLYAADIKYFSGEGGMWVTFTVDDGEAVPAKAVTFKEPVLRDQHIKERTGGITHLPVIKLNLCVGTVAFETEVSVLPRTAFAPPLVLSRADLSQLGPVDTQKQYLAGDPRCAPPAPQKPPNAPPQ